MGINNSKMKNLFATWHFMRFLRLALALYLAYQAYMTSQWFFGMFALFFMAQAVFNVGCCNASGCSVSQKDNDSKNQPLDYEEIK